jgi:protein-disulfide isomerase/uncharacterized membrane protein
MNDNSVTSSAKRNLVVISILSLIGMIIAVFQTKQFHETRSGTAGFHSFCNIGQTFDCTAIEMSKYADIGGFPLSAVAIAGYALILGLSLFAMSEAYRRTARKYILPFAVISVLFSAAYLAIMLGVIGKLCLLCLAVDAVNVLMLIFAIRLPKDFSTPGGMSPGLVGGVGVTSVVLAVLLSLGTNPQADVKKSDLNDMVESVMNSPVKQVEIPSDAPVLGNPDAKVTIVKFSDYECPACRLAANAIHPLFKRYMNDVKFVFVNFPLDQACNPEIKRPMHQYACEAATAAICAQEQGKFIEAYETLFESQDSFKAGGMADLVGAVPGIDKERLKTCMVQPSTMDKIKRDVALGVKLPIQSTPTFFINGRRVEGGLPTNLWMEVIDRMLKQ